VQDTFIVAGAAGLPFTEGALAAGVNKAQAAVYFGAAAEYPRAATHFVACALVHAGPIGKPYEAFAGGGAGAGCTGMNRPPQVATTGLGLAELVRAGLWVASLTAGGAFGLAVAALGAAGAAAQVAGARVGPSEAARCIHRAGVESALLTQASAHHGTFGHASHALGFRTAGAVAHDCAAPCQAPVVAHTAGLDRAVDASALAEARARGFASWHCLDEWQCTGGQQEA
jgi:hypothetical protein